MQIALSPDEARLLAELLEAEVADLRLEIRDTDDYDFKEVLRERQKVIEGLVNKLEVAAGRNGAKVSA